MLTSVARGLHELAALSLSPGARTGLPFVDADSIDRFIASPAATSPVIARARVVYENGRDLRETLTFQRVQHFLIAEAAQLREHGRRRTLEEIAEWVRASATPASR